MYKPIGVVLNENLKDRLTFSVKDELRLARGIFNGPDESMGDYVKRNRLDVEENNVQFQSPVPKVLEEIANEKFQAVNTAANYIIDNCTKFNPVPINMKIRDELIQLYYELKNTLSTNKLSYIPVNDQVQDIMNIKRGAILKGFNQQIKHLFLDKYYNYMHQIHLFGKPEEALARMYKTKITMTKFSLISTAGFMGLFGYIFHTYYGISKQTKQYDLAAIVSIITAIPATIVLKGGFDKIKNIRKYQSKLRELQSILKEEMGETI